MATKLVKVNDMDEALRLWKAGLLCSSTGWEWGNIKYYKNEEREAASASLWGAYVLVDADEE